MQSEFDDYSPPKYPSLEIEGIFDPVALVERYRKTHPGEIRSIAGITKPRCPPGKKAAEAERKQFRHPHEFHTIPVDWAKSPGVPSDVPVIR